eukprot:CAMPEP_0170248040 /NCGR_PEP_ID=MMETSP0116_2-20130129/23811_1 /TAXON_ID=400756 /ORGANISM="Durinskia baltica, Strain CSIRO CS-38" /LENGTH=287 /DNA_ID=CAMNT_0010498925 /DNA_START=75 /DNA_END=936 /DNA_ORIENTATION=-
MQANRILAHQSAAPLPRGGVRAAMLAPGPGFGAADPEHVGGAAQPVCRCRAFCWIMSIFLALLAAGWICLALSLFARRPLWTPAAEAPAAFDCNGDDGAWQRPRKEWCCERRGVGCPHFDCDADFEVWEVSWPAAKQAWCCAHVRRGCSTAVPSPPNAIAVADTAGDGSTGGGAIAAADAASRRAALRGVQARNAPIVCATAASMLACIAIVVCVARRGAHGRLAAVPAVGAAVALAAVAGGLGGGRPGAADPAGVDFEDRLLQPRPADALTRVERRSLASHTTAWA